MGDRGATAAGGEQAQRRREVSAGAVARNRQAGGIAAQVDGRGGHPFGSGVDVLQARRKGMLRRQAVVDGDKQGACVDGEGAAVDVGIVEIARDPPSAVHEEDDGKRRRAGRPVDAHPDRDVPPWDLHVVDPFECGRRGHQLTLRDRLRPHLLDGLDLHVEHAELDGALHDRAALGGEVGRDLGHATHRLALGWRDRTWHEDRCPGETSTGGGSIRV